jgi:hypothetical protein
MEYIGIINQVIKLFQEFHQGADDPNPFVQTPVELKMMNENFT